MESLGIGGKKLQLFNRALNNDSPITETDFEKSNLDQFKSIVLSKAKQTGKSKGVISNKDYIGSSLDRGIIGRFNWEIIGDDIVITDTYDFNKVELSEDTDNAIIEVLGSVFAPGQMAASIGRKLLPEGKGLPIKIKIPKD